MLSEQKAEGLIFGSDQFICLEVMLPVTEKNDENNYINKKNAIHDIIKFDGNLSDFSNLITHYVQLMTGFDRVFCLRFADDKSSFVIAESNNGVYSSNISHFFPASDVPSVLHMLYGRNRFRYMPNRLFEPVPILDSNKKSEQMDLKDSLSRSIAQTHLIYLKNMNVQSTCSFSIVINGTLWGLIGAHKKTMGQLSLKTLLDIQDLVEFFSIRLNLIKENSMKIEFSKRLRYIDEIKKSFELNDCDICKVADITVAILKKIIKADSIIWADQNCSGSDTVPTKDIESFVNFAKKKTAQIPVFYTTRLADKTKIKVLGKEFSGMFALSLDDKSLIIWLRYEKKQTKKWSGNPNTALPTDANGNTLPRSSFESWIEDIHQTSAIWDDTDYNIAIELRDCFANIKARHFSQLKKQNYMLEQEIAKRTLVENELQEINNQLKSFAHVTSHDLQQPLRSIANYCQFLQNDYSELLDSRGQLYFSHIINGVKTMSLRIKSILQYSSLNAKSILPVTFLKG